MWNFLFIEVIISSLLLVILFYYVIKKKEEILSRETFEKIKESYKQLRIVAYLLLLSFFLFILHEASEVIPHFFALSPEQEDLLFLRHNIIYLPLIPFQCLVISMIIRALRRT
jgi:hypothetical protein